MKIPVSTPQAAAPAWQADHDALFAALGDPVRRRILTMLADGEPRTATALRGASHRRLDATLKHLIVLRRLGLVLMTENPADGHRALYRLGPGIEVRPTHPGREMDFGPVMLRLA